MRDIIFSIRRYFSKPRRNAAFIALFILGAGFVIRELLADQDIYFLSLLLVVAITLSTYFLIERAARLRGNVEVKTLALNQAIRDLEKSRASFQQIVAELPIPTIITNDTTERVEYLNNKFIETFGYTVDEVSTSAAWWKKAYPDKKYREKVQATWGKAIEKALKDKTQIPTQEWDVVSKDGSIKRVLFDMMPIGERSIIVMNDLSERRATEQELENSEERFRALFVDSADAYLIIEDNIFVDCNKATLDMLRASSKEEVLATHPSELSPEYQPDGQRSNEKADEMMRIAIEQGSNRFEWIHRRLDGENFPVEVLLTPIPTGKKTIIHTVWRDITDQKKKEETLRQNAVRLRKYFDQPYLGMAITSPNKEWLEVNDALCNMLGYSREELSNLNWEELTHPEDVNKNFEEFKQVQAGEKDGYVLEKRYIRKDGSIFYAELSSSALRNDDGTVEAMSTLINDITERKAAHERTLTLLNSIPANIYVSEFDTYEILFMNDFMKEAYEGEVLGQICHQLFRHEESPCSICPRGQLVDEDGKPTQEVVWETQNPVSKKWYMIYDRAIPWVDGRIVHVQISLDISERKSAEEALQNLNITLDDRVGQRTRELHQTISAMADREIRMVELKKVITKLREQLREAGLEPKAYDPLLGPDREW